MNKTELINEVSKRTDVPKATVKKVIDATLDVVADVLNWGGKVQLVGFGSFYVTTRKARKGRNPRTGEVINIPARKVVRFRAGKQLTDLVNK
ncbi:MAG: HU family DNA-binding protein [Chlorobi bacterium]|nr:HU family DNA-binding protein [Chlorobiota bacterium]